MNRVDIEQKKNRQYFIVKVLDVVCDKIISSCFDM